MKIVRENLMLEVGLGFTLFFPVKTYEHPTDMGISHVQNIKIK